MSFSVQRNLRIEVHNNNRSIINYRYIEILPSASSMKSNLSGIWVINFEGRICLPYFWQSALALSGPQRSQSCYEAFVKLWCLCVLLNSSPHCSSSWGMQGLQAVSQVPVLSGGLQMLHSWQCLKSLIKKSMLSYIGNVNNYFNQEKYAFRTLIRETLI